MSERAIYCSTQYRLNHAASQQRQAAPCSPRPSSPIAVPAPSSGGRRRSRPARHPWRPGSMRPPRSRPRPGSCCICMAAPSSAARWRRARRSRRCWPRPGPSSSRSTIRWRRRIAFPRRSRPHSAALVAIGKGRARWAAKHAPLYVAGEEAGGNLAAALALMARDRRGPALAGQILLSPMLDACLGTSSLRAADAGPGRLPLGRWLGRLSRHARQGGPPLCRAAQRLAARRSARPPC